MTIQYLQTNFNGFALNEVKNGYEASISGLYTLKRSWQEPTFVTLDKVTAEAETKEGSAQALSEKIADAIAQRREEELDSLYVQIHGTVLIPKPPIDVSKQFSEIQDEDPRHTHSHYSDIIHMSAIREREDGVLVYGRNFHANTSLPHTHLLPV